MAGPVCSFLNPHFLILVNVEEVSFALNFILILRSFSLHFDSAILILLASSKKMGFDVSHLIEELIDMVLVGEINTFILFF